MIKLTRILAPIDDTPFDEICSFETENYIGVFVDFVDSSLKDGQPGFIVMPKCDSEFSMDLINFVDTLEKLDERVYSVTEERIIAVSTSRCLDIKINEDY